MNVSVGLNAVALVYARYRQSGFAGRDPAGASSGGAFSGKAKLGGIGEPAARSAGPLSIQLAIPQAEDDYIRDPDGRAPAQEHGGGVALGGVEDVLGQDDAQHGAGGQDDQQGGPH
ncbi:MAG: hypothetical protein ACJ75K_29950 [Actinomycetes bacterium]